MAVTPGAGPDLVPFLPLMTLLVARGYPPDAPPVEDEL